MAEEGKGKIEKFNDMNFQWWKMQVEDYLYQKDLYLPLVGEKPKAMNASEWSILDRKALATRKTISDGISSSTGLSVKSRGRQNNKQNNRGRSPTRGRSRGKSKSKGKTMVCWNCNKEGHKKNDFTEPKKKKGARGRQGDDEGANMKNLISVSGLDCEGYFVAFGEKQWKVIKGSMAVARGERVRTLYTLSGMKNIQLDFCEGCVYGKQKRVSFQRDGKEKKIERLESLASALNGGIPEEEWSGKPVNYSFWRVFGCIAYAHIDKEERKKLDSKSHKRVFIGYGGDEYGYRLWDYEHNKIIRSKDVIFDESRLYKHRLQEHGIEKDNKEYMELDEPEDGQVPRKENPEVLDKTTDTEIGAGDQQQVPKTLNLRRNDMLVAGSSMGRINELKKKLASTFSMKDLGEAKQLLDMRITRDRKQKKLWLSQEEYIDKVLRRFNLHASKPVTTPLAAHFKLSKELSPKNREDEEYMAHVSYTSTVGSIMYLRGTSRFCLCFEGDNIDVRGYVDADHAELGYGQVDCKLWTDSQSAIHLAKNSAFHSRTKHIQLRYHFIRSLLEDGQLNLEKIEGNKNPADMLTKVVDRQKLSLCSTLISLR
ncbi:hypothetical protein RJ639_001198 [Escallonia herrerae]|uniref:Uncharacterized protein n=1 Tax=Escallonia herrerae TaxID=1293975 RepID=A0AA88XAV8_9ASTE|nr:hypothetical protein RJ639_001198 [Escallonia herrerae]